MRIAILTALHQRYPLTRLFLSYYARTWDNPLFCVIDDDDLDMWEIVRQYPEWRFTTARNEPLADKWLAGMHFVKEHAAEFEAVMIVGSDDFIDQVYRDHIEVCIDLIHDMRPEPVYHIVPRHIHYLDAPTQRLMRVRHKRPGAGRVLSKAMLERLSWTPWRAGDSNIDGSMDKAILRVFGESLEYSYIEDDIGTIMDVKVRRADGTQGNIWTYDHLLRKPHEELDTAPFLRKRFPLIADHLLYWNELHSNADGRYARALRAAGRAAAERA